MSRDDISAKASPRNGDHEDENDSSQAKPGTAAFMEQVEKTRSIKVRKIIRRQESKAHGLEFPQCCIDKGSNVFVTQVAGSSSFIGLTIVLFAGVCCFIFSPAFNLASNDQWHVLKKGVPHLVVYTAFFYFYLSGFVLAICVNVWLLYRPIAGVPASTIGAYLKDWNGRHWALLSGLLCGFCNAFQFMGGQAAGFATADAVMASPLVCAFWDIVVFGEYRRSSRKTYLLLAGMLTMFVMAIGVLLASAGHRKHT
ncbi:hypothetical protein EJB05_28399 [Eragrostis curvula]|uniref:Ureide permease 2 n=1 Tax=Eragrostis curvula TaxID=38414 RepID=A0A5J9UQ30_9POAL|nr:hypothetical protein EJB05_28399 [Eragrostis curvula]